MSLEDKCPECSGIGVLRYDNSDDKLCPNCRGSGRVARQSWIADYDAVYLRLTGAVQNVFPEEVKVALVFEAMDILRDMRQKIERSSNFRGGNKNESVSTGVE